MNIVDKVHSVSSHKEAARELLQVPCVVTTCQTVLRAGCHVVLQQALDVVDRVYSLSSYTVAACGQLQVACTQEAPPEEMLYDAEYLDPLLANVDGIITSTSNETLQPQFAFSASTDPGWC